MLESLSLSLLLVQWPPLSIFLNEEPSDACCLLGTAAGSSTTAHSGAVIDCQCFWLGGCYCLALKHPSSVRCPAFEEVCYCCKISNCSTDMIQLSNVCTHARIRICTHHQLLPPVHFLPSHVLFANSYNRDIAVTVLSINSCIYAW